MVRPKGNLSRGHLRAIVLLIAASALLVVLRMPWSPASGALARFASLSHVSPDMADRLGYVLIVPFGALVVVFFRLTLGINLLGPFRSILIAMAFLATGFSLGLVFLTLVVGVILAIRPMLKRIELPYFGRVSVILSAVAGIIVAATLVAAWFDIDLLRRVAHFPIVALCLTGEGMASKLDKEGTAASLWRGGMTVLVAVLIAAICRIPGVDRLLLSCPELLLLQVVSIVLISEYLDLGLLSGLNPRSVPQAAAGGEATAPDAAPGPAADGSAASIRPGGSRSVEGLRVALVHDGGAATASARGVAVHLQARGHCVELLTPGATSCELARFLEPAPPPQPVSAQRPRGVVVSLAGDDHGRDAAAIHREAALEAAGILCVGGGALGRAVTLDRIVLRGLLRDAGVPTPRSLVSRHPDEGAGELCFPLRVLAGLNGSRSAAIVDDRRELALAVTEVISASGRAALVEECVSGREVSIALLGNDPVEAFPPVEPAAPGRGFRRAAMHEALCSRFQGIARRAFAACHGRDLGRVDFLIDRRGNAHVVDVSVLPALDPGGSFAAAAECAGLGFATLLARIVEVALQRAADAGRAARGAQAPIPATTLLDAVC
jgi:D-alanine-D-alanine ligase